MDEPRFSKSFFDEVLSPSWTGRGDFAGATGFSFDSRTLVPGECFVALRTGGRDGHEFLGDAAERGASGALVAAPGEGIDLPQATVPDTLRALQELGAAWRRRWDGRVIGVTGSCGKTSTKELLGLLLGGEDTLVSPGNWNNHIGVPLSLLRLRPEHRTAVIEAGISEGGEMERLAALAAPDVAVVTTIGPAHLEKLGSLEGIAAEKARFPLAARERVFLGPACADYREFTGADFAGANWVLREVRAEPFAGRGTVWRIALEPEADGGPPRVRLRADGEGVGFRAPEGTAGMIENACLAVLVARAEGVAEDLLRERLARWRPASQRGEIVEHGGRLVYADHYNANPASFADAAFYFDRRFPDPPRSWVIGSMEELGAESAVWHRKLAAALPVAENDRIFLVGEMAAEMESVLRGKATAGKVVVAAEAGEIADAVAAGPGTVFLKGSRKYRLEKILDSLAASG